MYEDVSNGYHFINYCGERVREDERWHSRCPIYNEEILSAKLKRSLAWMYDHFFAYEGSLITNAYTVLRTDAKELYNLDSGFVLIQSVYTHPSQRGNGICRRFLDSAMAIAEKEGAALAAVARPFIHSSEKEDSGIPTIKQIAADFANNPERLEYLSLKTDEGKLAQEKMVGLFRSYGWQKVDLRPTMSDPNTFGDFAYWTGES
jgi:GNAT superfamily N-acetyltransferase